MNSSPDCECTRDQEFRDIHRTERKLDQAGLELAARVLGIERREALLRASVEKLNGSVSIMVSRVGEPNANGNGPTGLHKVWADHVNPIIRAQYDSARPIGPTSDMAPAVENESEDTKQTCITREAAVIAKRQAEATTKKVFEQMIMHESAKLEAERRLREAQEKAAALAREKEAADRQKQIADRRQQYWKWGAGASVVLVGFFETADRSGLFRLIGKAINAIFGG